MEDVELIRKAVTKHRGGLENASDSQILIIWNSLDKETQNKYLSKVKPKERKEKHAVGTGTKHDL